MSRLRTAGSVLGLAAILGVAGVVAHLTPEGDDWQEPVAVPGVVGERAEGYNLAATVSSAELADALDAGNGWTGETPGAWVVIELTAEAVRDDTGALLFASLRIGDATYTASERSRDATLYRTGLATGIPVSGPVLFEVPAAALEAGEPADLRLAATDDPRLDSLITVPIDLASLEHRPVRELPPVVRGAR